MEGHHAHNEQTGNRHEALIEEFLRVRDLVVEKEKMLSELRDDSSNAVTMKAGLHIQLETLRTKLTRATQNLLDAGIDIESL